MNRCIDPEAKIKAIVNKFTTHKVEDVAEILADVDSSNLSDENWNKVINTACRHCNVSTDTMLASIERIHDYEAFFADEAEAYYQMLMGAEDPIYGCDPYSEY
mgnify:FL=1